MKELVSQSLSPHRRKSQFLRVLSLISISSEPDCQSRLPKLTDLSRWSKMKTEDEFRKGRSTPMKFMTSLIFMLSFPLTAFSSDVRVDVMNRLASIFSEIQPRRDLCERQRPGLESQRYCQDFPRTVCEESSEPRADPTGVAYNNFRERKNEYFRALQASASTHVADLMQNSSITNAARRELFKNIGPRDNNRLRACLERIVVLRSEVQRGFFSTPEDLSLNIGIAKNYLLSSDTGNVRCEVKSDGALLMFLQHREIRAAGEKLDNDVRNALNVRNAPSLQKVGELFGTAQRITIKLLTEKMERESDSSKRQALDLVIARVERMRLGNCGSRNPNGIVDNVHSFGRSAFYNRRSNEVNYCSGSLLNCASEMCTLTVLAHEIAESFTPCMFDRAAPGGPIASTNPFESSISCFKNSNRFAFATNSSSNLCSDRHLNEGFSDQHSADVLAEYLTPFLEQNRQEARLMTSNVSSDAVNASGPKMAQHELRASIANAATRICNAPDFSSNSSDYPGRLQRLRIFQTSNALQSLAGCRSSSENNSCLYGDDL